METKETVDTQVLEESKVDIENDAYSDTQPQDSQPPILGNLEDSFIGA